MGWSGLLGEGGLVLYWLARLVLRAYIRWRYKQTVEGSENLPRRGAVILCPNHINFWDPVTVACSIGRRVSFMAKEELFRNPVVALALRLVGAFPVKRGKADRAAIRHSLRVLGRGQVLGIFPEGTRSRTGVLQKAEPGAALLALRTRAPVVPVGICGSYRRPARVVVRFGPTLTFPEHYGARPTAERLEHVGSQIMAAIAALLPESQVRIGPG
ncbi:MAG: 1-acyl-sn-glycerol-3-phosphate acyltransferase [Acetobacteraceae bacterium]|nr:1-acyl-sn-glycerol-3-phosphate acyltransferase [Acetobacteraceae bacterium]